MSDVIVTIEINGIKKELFNSDVIVCKTEDEAKLLFIALNDDGYLWCNEDHLNENNTCYHVYEEGYGYSITPIGLEHSKATYYKGKACYNIMYFDELFTPRVTVEGLWEIFSAMVMGVTENGMDYDEMSDCFGSTDYDDIIKNNTPQSLVSKYNAWKDSKVKIEVGDIFEDSYSSNKFIVISEKDSDRDYEILDDCYDKSYMNESIFEDYKKVGHKDITNLFTP